ncbi:hypothetical protein [Sphingomonas montana]|uniref:hypothetical protein n=1 Tax=Sphingomonas montana TaxID=1843236 RepID=UPI00101AD6B7|nr:hypothetical protein [Sphingomonas montana]
MTMVLNKRVRRRWTDAEDADLRARIDAGELLPVIARALDRTQMACSTRAESLGLRTRSTVRPVRVGIHHEPVV